MPKYAKFTYLPEQNMKKQSIESYNGEHSIGGSDLQVQICQQDEISWHLGTLPSRLLRQSAVDTNTNKCDVVF